MKLYIFRTVPLSIIGSFSLYIQQWYMSKVCCMYSEKLLMMDRGTVRNMYSFILGIYVQGLLTYTIAVCTVKNS
jgi:hypothetical protein